jgi:hypothetical protein
MSRIWVCALLAVVAAGCMSSKQKQVTPEKPLVVHMEQHDVPDTVMQSFYSTYPNATIREVNKEVFSDGTVRYVFKFRSVQGGEREARFSSTGGAVADLR